MMASTIFRGRRWDFDDALCRCQQGDTTGQFAKCPICHPERYADPDRLVAWLTAQSAAGHFPAWWHVYDVARSWLDPPRGGEPLTPRQRRIVSDLASKDRDRYAEWIVPDPDPGRAPRLTAEASRARIASWGE